MNVRGAYSDSTAYGKLDVVLYSGSSYICKNDGTIAIVPTNTTYWQLLAQAGQATMTEQQKQEIISTLVSQGVIIDPDYNTFTTAEKNKLAGLSTPNNGTLTINCNGGRLGTFTANQSGNTTVNIPNIIPVSDAKITLWDSTNDRLIDYFTLNQNDEKTIRIPIGSGGGSTPNNGTLTIEHDGSTLGTFTANQSGDTTVTIPTINNGTLTVKRNNTTVGTFSADQSSDATLTISVPDSVNDLNDGLSYAPMRSYTDDYNNLYGDTLTGDCVIDKLKSNVVYNCQNATTLKINNYDYDGTIFDSLTNPVTYIIVEADDDFTVDLTNLSVKYELTTGNGLTLTRGNKYLVTVLGNTFKVEELS